MRVVVTGDRHWTDRRTVEAVVDLLPPDTTLIHGDAQGLDRMAGEVAALRGLEVIVMPADWGLGPQGGNLRNQEMLDLDPWIVFAFHDDLPRSKGTKDCINRARKAAIRTYLCKVEANFRGQEALRLTIC